MQTENLPWRLMESMRRMNGQIERKLHPLCAQHGITTLQLSILLTLYMRGEQTVSSLARHTCMAGANNSALCKRLERDGFVQRERALADERQVLVSLTPKGSAVADAFMELCETHRQLLLDHVTNEQMDDILKGFHTLLGAMEMNPKGDADEQ